MLLLVDIIHTKTLTASSSLSVLNHVNGQLIAANPKQISIRQSCVIGFNYVALVNYTKVLFIISIYVIHIVIIVQGKSCLAIEGGLVYGHIGQKASIYPPTCKSMKKRQY